MDNMINQETAYAEYMEVKRGLQKKVGILGLCALAFFIMFRLANKDASFFSCARDGFYCGLAMYLPYRISYQATGSFVGSIIGSLVIVVIAGLVLGDSSALLGGLLLSGMAIDFGCSIWRMWSLKKLFLCENE